MFQIRKARTLQQLILSQFLKFFKFLHRLAIGPQFSFYYPLCNTHTYKHSKFFLQLVAIPIKKHCCHIQMHAFSVVQGIIEILNRDCQTFDPPAGISTRGFGFLLTTENKGIQLNSAWNSGFGNSGLIFIKNFTFAYRKPTLQKSTTFQEMLANMASGNKP